MLVFSRRKGQWPWNTANCMNALHWGTPATRARAQWRAAGGKALLSHAEAEQPTQIPSRLNSVILPIPIYSLNCFKCHFILQWDEVPSQTSYSLRVQADLISSQSFWSWNFQSNHASSKNEQHLLSILTEQSSMATLTACFFWTENFSSYLHYGEGKKAPNPETAAKIQIIHKYRPTHSRTWQYF